MKRAIYGALIVLFGIAIAFGGTRSDKARIIKFNDSGDRDLLSAVSLAAAEASRTITQDVEGSSRAVIYALLADANTDCTSLELTCSGSLDERATWGRVTSRSIVSGTSTVSSYEDTIARTDAILGAILIYDIWGMTDFRCIYSATGTCSSDTVTTQWNVTSAK